MEFWFKKLHIDFFVKQMYSHVIIQNTPFTYVVIMNQIRQLSVNNCINRRGGARYQVYNLLLFDACKSNIVSLPFLERLPILTSSFRSGKVHYRLSKSATLLQIPRQSVYFTSAKNGSYENHLPLFLHDICRENVNKITPFHIIIKEN